MENANPVQLAGGTMINIGEIRITEKANEIVWSVLGSCISVIFRVNEKLALLCHAQMPYNKEFGTRCADSCPRPCFHFLPDSMELKYVSCAIEYMIHYLKKRRIPLQGLSTSLIGGASRLTEMSFSIGEENQKAARETLERHGISVNRSATGGVRGCTFWYRPGDDRLLIRRHSTTEKKSLAQGQHLRFDD